MRIFILFGLLLPFISYSQPYIDLVNTRYVNSPGTLNNFQGKDPSIHYLNISTNLPVTKPGNRILLVLSPFTDRWILPIEGQKDLRFTSYALPITTIVTLNNKWNLSTSLITRNNSFDANKEDWQIGGAMIAGFKKTDRLTYRFGVYMNTEFFGFFVVPLVGIQWKINHNTHLFGLLPGNLVFEKKTGRSTYIGASFRAITNSYGQQKSYFRFDENQLGIFADQYLSKNIVVNIEAGHSLFRKIRTGNRYQKGARLNADDSFYLKAGLAFRLRLDN